jgi:hypothetical protein
MVQLLGQRQHIVVNKISTLKLFKELSEAGEAFEINVNATPEVLKEEQLLINISIGK